MKKKILVLLLTLIVAVSIILTASAESENTFIKDYAGILSVSEQQELEEYAASVSAKYNCGIYIVIVPDMSEFAYSDALQYAKDVYTELSLGYGDGFDGELLLLSMEERDYALISHGSYANNAFTDYAKDIVCDSFLDNFRYDDWFGGFRDYLVKSAEVLDYAENRDPYEADSYYYPDTVAQKSFSPSSIVIALAIGCIIALIACSSMKSKMKSVQIQRAAEVYVTNAGLQLSVATDRFSHVTEVRQRIEHDNNSRSSSGNSGFSGKSGKF